MTSHVRQAALENAAAVAEKAAKKAAVEKAAVENPSAHTICGCLT